jgi:hypothetical protein
VLDQKGGMHAAQALEPKKHVRPLGAPCASSVPSVRKPAPYRGMDLFRPAAT